MVREGVARTRFDIEAGREEVVNRRVGRNDIFTIETLRATVEAQGEFAARDLGQLGRDDLSGQPAGRSAWGAHATCPLVLHGA